MSTVIWLVGLVVALYVVYMVAAGIYGASQPPENNGANYTKHLLKKRGLDVSKVPPDCWREIGLLAAKAYNFHSTMLAQGIEMPGMQGMRGEGSATVLIKVCEIVSDLIVAWAYESSPDSSLGEQLSEIDNVFRQFGLTPSDLRPNTSASR